MSSYVEALSKLDDGTPEWVEVRNRFWREDRDGYRRWLDDMYRDEFGNIALEHSHRFRRVSTGYPHAVAMAYDRDLERAAADTDERAAATVAAWERAQGREPIDWRAVGAEEQEET